MILNRQESLSAIMINMHNLDSNNTRVPKHIHPREYEDIAMKNYTRYDTAHRMIRRNTSLMEGASEADSDLAFVVQTKFSSATHEESSIADSSNRDSISQRATHYQRNKASLRAMSHEIERAGQADRERRAL